MFSLAEGGKLEIRAELSGRDVHVWTLPTQVADSVALKFEAVLSPDEKDRAARFRFDHLRRSFVVARGALRSLLGRYLGIRPASLHFHYGSKGKPALASPAPIDFNATHSGDLAAFAFIVGCQIGIDVELIRPLDEMKEIAGRFFCPNETTEILSLEPTARERAFFCCWTRKEAYIKAIGDGLSAPLYEFRVTVQPHELPRIIHLAHDMTDAKAWTLHDLRLAPDYAGAIAYRGLRRSLSVFPILDPTEFHDTR